MPFRTHVDITDRVRIPLLPEKGTENRATMMGSEKETGESQGSIKKALAQKREGEVTAGVVGCATGASPRQGRAKSEAKSETPKEAYR